MAAAGTAIRVVRMAAHPGVRSRVRDVAVLVPGVVPGVAGITALGVVAGVLAVVEADVLVDVIVHVLVAVVVVMDADQDVPEHAKGVATAVIMGAKGTVMAVVKGAVIVNAMDVPVHVLPDVGEDVQAVRGVRAVVVGVHKDAVVVVVVIAGGVLVVAVAVRAVQTARAATAVQAVAAAAAGTAIRAVRMPVLLSVRLQPAGAAAVPVLRGVPAAAGTHAHQTARPDARIAVRPHAHRPAILPARTSALAVRNKRNSETKIYNKERIYYHGKEIS